jgi:hydroxymethylbilane synthase
MTTAQSSALLRVGTRGSPLALAQAQTAAQLITSAASLSGDCIKIQAIRTTGDIILDRPLAEAGGKGLFTKEIDEALLRGDIHLAVHSAKDLPTVLPSGLHIAAVIPREDARDAFISKRAKSLHELPSGASVGTSSLRRQALVRFRHRDLAVVNLRGNVETRLRKIETGAADATLLALAGLKRLGLAHVATAVLDIDEFPPAVGQGIVALVARSDDSRTSSLLHLLTHAPTASALAAERAFLTVLDGSCRTPIAGYATVKDRRLHFRGLIARADGSAVLQTEREGIAQDAALIGADAGRELKLRAGSHFFAPH